MSIAMRIAIRKGFAIVTLGVIIAGGVATAMAWRGLGHRAEGARRDRMHRSPQWQTNHFANPQPLMNDIVGGLFAMGNASSASVPPHAVPVERIARSRFTVAPPSGLRITWMGHSTALIEIDGARVLIDPIWSARPSPLPSIGPARWYAPVIALDSLPPIDVVLISHDHYDHLDMPTVVALARTTTRFVVPLGVGAHLAYWGVRADHITELDWWDSTRVGALTVYSTPARHASGRMVIDNDATLWSGFAIVGAAHRVYYSGDTGLFPAMREIGERLGPFDCTLIEIGQYHRAWPDWHIGPEQAVAAHVLVRGRVLMPVHWALFRLAYHGWTEPIERVTAEAARLGEMVATPRPGESVEPTLPLRTTRWWPALPWETAAQHPIVSTQLR
jgi:L-ascorbate metabolism protein UlaG (beta-lactamase superfamily)